MHAAGGVAGVKERRAGCGHGGEGAAQATSTVVRCGRLVRNVGADLEGALEFRVGSEVRVGGEFARGGGAAGTAWLWAIVLWHKVELVGGVGVPLSLVERERGA